MKLSINPFLKSALLTTSVFLYCGAYVHAETLAFNAQVGTNTTTHTIDATDWAAYLPDGSNLFNAEVNDGGRLYWRGVSSSWANGVEAGDGNYMHFDLSSLTGLVVVEPVSLTLQNSNAYWGGGVNGSYVATADAEWTAAAGNTVSFD